MLLADFNAEEYTRTAILEELLLVERHARDGSALDAGCGCIEEKHLLTLSGLCNEAGTLMTDANEKEYYQKLGQWARERRREIIEGNFKPASVSCERKVAKCVGEGRTESECRSVHNC